MELLSKIAAQPFDSVAPTYDESFSNTALGERMRAITHAHFDKYFHAADWLLELGSGTGIDALYWAKRRIGVFATDASAAMLKVSQARFENEFQLENTVQCEFNVLRWEEINRVRTEKRFKGIVSNFGSINCVANLSQLSMPLAELLEDGGTLLLVFMSRFCLFESVYFFLSFAWKNIFRRLNRAGQQVPVGREFVRTYYYSAADFNKAFKNEFTCVEIAAVGLLTPPTYLQKFYQRYHWLFKVLLPIEDALSRLPLLRNYGDHTFIAFRKKDNFRI